MSKKERVMKLKLSDIFIDPELKVRVETDEATAKEYYDAMATAEAEKKFPRPTVYFDGCRYMLVDGHHRYLAAIWRKFETMEFTVIDGTRDEAILAAVKLNLTNGLRFKEGDWEKIVLIIASKKAWKDWTNRRLAKELNCSYETVRRYRPDSVDTGVSTEKRMGKDGKMYKAKKEKKPDVAATESAQADETVTESAVTPQSTATAVASTTVPEAVEASLPEPDEAVVVTTEIEADTPKPEVELETGNDSLADDRRRIDLNVKQTQIETTISLLEGQLYEWLEIAQSQEARDCRQDIAKRLHALADDFMTDVIS